MTPLNHQTLHVISGAIRPSIMPNHNLSPTCLSYAKFVSSSGEVCEMFNFTNIELARRINKLLSLNYTLVALA